MTQPFPTLDALVRRTRVILPRPRETWRLVTDPLVGQINGIDRIRGGSVATNGIMVALLDEHEVLRFGHLDWFVPDADESHVDLSDLWFDAKVETFHSRRVARHEKTLADYLDY